jgi:molybdopterin synthase sulfur carrier subunit
MKLTMSGNLLRFCQFRHEIDVDGVTIQEGMNELVAQCPALLPVLFDGQGRLRQAHRLFHNGDMISRDDVQRPSGPADEIAILTAIAGG